MKPLILAALILPAASLHALTIPSDGSDGNFHPTEDIEVDLSQAVTGVWDQNNAANIGKGVYDPEKWAIIFKYNSVTIPEGVTVTFKNHATRAPVVWLVQGNVNIAGTVNLNGQGGTTGPLALTPAEPGPGGFRGGPVGPAGAGPGLGIGASDQGNYQSSYGNPAILPLIGGSGGPAVSGGHGSGAAGGGAILIASAGNITANGQIWANAGPRSSGGVDARHGSGGAIKLIAESVSGSGTLSAHSTRNASTGRIRIETSSLSPVITMTPETVAVPPADPPILWPGEGAPTVRIVSVAGQSAPADPTAPLQSTSDVGITHNAAVQVVVETTNFPPSGIVQVRRAPKFGGTNSAAWTTLTHADGNFTHSTWTANIVFPGGYTALQARATVP